ncbi:hypothetical protein BJX70DRAFT_394178 [Aspergillus crustosus]
MVSPAPNHIYRLEYKDRAPDTYIDISDIRFEVHFVLIQPCIDRLHDMEPNRSSFNNMHIDLYKMRFVPWRNRLKGDDCFTAVPEGKMEPLEARKPLPEDVNLAHSWLKAVYNISQDFSSMEKLEELFHVTRGFLDGTFVSGSPRWMGAYLEQEMARPNNDHLLMTEEWSVTTLLMAQTLKMTSLYHDLLIRFSDPVYLLYQHKLYGTAGVQTYCRVFKVFDQRQAYMEDLRRKVVKFDRKLDHWVGSRGLWEVLEPGAAIEVFGYLTNQPLHSIEGPRVPGAITDVEYLAKLEAAVHRISEQGMPAVEDPLLQDILQGFLEVIDFYKLDGFRLQPHSGFDYISAHIVKEEDMTFD